MTACAVCSDSSEDDSLQYPFGSVPSITYSVTAEVVADRTSNPL